MGFLGFMNNNAFGTGLNGWQFAGLAASHWANPQGTAPVVAGINQNRFKAADVQMRLASIEEAKTRSQEYIANAALDRAMRLQALQFDRARFKYGQEKDSAAFQADKAKETQDAYDKRLDFFNGLIQNYGPAPELAPVRDWVKTGGDMPALGSITPQPGSMAAGRIGTIYGKSATIDSKLLGEYGDEGSYNRLRSTTGNLLNLTGQPQGLTFGMEKPTPAAAVAPTENIQYDEQTKAQIFAMASTGMAYTLFGQGAFGSRPAPAAPVTQPPAPVQQKPVVSQTTTRQPGALPPVGGIKGPSTLPTPAKGSQVGARAATQDKTEQTLPGAVANSDVDVATKNDRIKKVGADTTTSVANATIATTKAGVAKQLASLDVQIKKAQLALDQQKLKKGSVEYQQAVVNLQNLKKQGAILQNKLDDPNYGKTPPKAPKVKSLLERTSTQTELKAFRAAGISERLNATDARASLKHWTKRGLIGRDGKPRSLDTPLYEEFREDQGGVHMRLAKERLVAFVQSQKAAGKPVKWEAIKAMPSFANFTQAEKDELSKEFRKAIR